MNADDTDEKTKARAKPSGLRGTAQGPSPTTARRDDARDGTGAVPYNSMRVTHPTLAQMSQGWTPEPQHDATA